MCCKLGSSLGQEGEQDFTTDKNEAYKGHQGERPQRRRGGDDNLRPEGGVDGDSESRWGVLYYLQIILGR